MNRFFSRLAILFIALFSFSLFLEAQNTRSTTRPGTNTNRANTGGGGGGNRNSSTNPYGSNTDVGKAMIAIDPETRSLIITTDEKTNLEIAKVIKDLDKPKPQVLIKVLFLEITYNKDLDYGLEGSYTFKKTSEGALETAFGLASETQGGFWRVLVDNWSATVRALAKNGKLEVLSRPAILARNNQEAQIIVGQEIPIITNTRITDNGQTLNTVQYQDIGIILRVTPFITPESMVEMIISPEISTLTDQTVPIGENVNSPVIAKRSAETVIVTPDKKTVVIGGLMDNKKTESISKIPLLGDIPWMGALFRRTIKSNTKTELLIFLTPTIINDPNELSSVSQDQVNDIDFPKDAFSKKELDKNLHEIAPHPEVRKALPVEKSTTE